MLEKCKADVSVLCPMWFLVTHMLSLSAATPHCGEEVCMRFHLIQCAYANPAKACDICAFHSFQKACIHITASCAGAVQTGMTGGA